MTTLSGVTWFVGYGEISEADLFRVGYVRSTTPEAYFPIAHLQDLILVLSNLPGGMNELSKGTHVQAEKVPRGLFTDVVVSPRLDTGDPVQIMRFDLGNLGDLQYVLGLLAADLSNFFPDDWDSSKRLPVVVRDDDGTLRTIGYEPVTIDAPSNPGTAGYVTGPGPTKDALDGAYAPLSVEGEVTNLQALTDTGRLSEAQLSAAFAASGEALSAISQAELVAGRRWS